MNDTERFKYDNVVGAKHITPTHIYEVYDDFKFLFNGDTVTLYELEGVRRRFSYYCNAEDCLLKHIIFSKDGFKMFLDFIGENKEKLGWAWDISASTCDGILLVEDESNHIWIEGSRKYIGIHTDILTKLNINLLNKYNL